MTLKAGGNIPNLMTLYTSNSNDLQICLQITTMITSFANDNTHNFASDEVYCINFSNLVLQILSHPSLRVCIYFLEIFIISIFVNIMYLDCISLPCIF